MSDDYYDPRAQTEGDAEPVDIPLDALSREALQGVIDDFILREGTDYGETEVPLERKRSQVLEQLKRGQARLTFDPRTETCTILPRNG